jgi:hypothetical protein
LVAFGLGLFVSKYGLFVSKYGAMMVMNFTHHNIAGVFCASVVTIVIIIFAGRFPHLKAYSL